MSADLTTLIAEHRFMARNAGGRMGCRGCTWTGTKPSGTDAAWAEYAAHLAAVIESSGWLAEHDREVAAGAWDEGASVGIKTPSHLGYTAINPYRAQAIREGRA